MHFCCHVKGISKGMGKKANRLIEETSPYLLQHAHNPVDWFPWGEDGFEKARRENKPVFLSIGYSSCHWCHVMEEESFENKEIAAYLNEYFVAINVDREERPDIDSAYMQFAVLTTGSGGWPLNVFLLPSGEPFFSGTYFPSQPKYGMPGFLNVLKIVKKRYAENQKEIHSFIGEIKKHLQVQDFNADDVELVDLEVLKKFDEAFLGGCDNDNGGMIGMPKFPPSLSLLFLMEQSKHLEKVFLTLKKMGDGGIYDHLGGGFFRYSVDEGWRVPHFEKMLYDNALLLKAYSWAFALSKDAYFKEKAGGVFHYVKETLLSENGFYSSQDADSEGEEGRFYAFSYGEIKRITDNELFLRYYCVEKHGEFGGNNVLRINEKVKLDEEEKQRIIEDKKKLLEYREKRVHPAIDKKIIVSWNGLMISGLIAYGRYCGNEEALQIADGVCRKLVEKCWDEKRVLRILGKLNLNGFLEDYSFLIYALLDLYEINFDDKYLNNAMHIAEAAIRDFYDGGFFDSGRKNDALFVKSYAPRDNVTPSGCGEMIIALFRLGLIFPGKGFMKIAEKELALNMQNMKDYPLQYPIMMMVIYGASGEFYDVGVSGDPGFVNEIKEFLLKIPRFNMQLHLCNGAKNNVKVCFRNACRECKSREELLSILLEQKATKVHG